MSIKGIMEFLKTPWVLAGLGIAMLLIVVFAFLRIIKKKQLNRRISNCEIAYNNCISIPISFKLNKATNIAKINPNIDNELQRIKNDYSDLEKRHEEISLILEDVDDALSVGKLKNASSLTEDLEMLITDAESLTGTLDHRLDKMLEEEISQREEITKLKDAFRQDKSRLANNALLYGNSLDVLEKEAKEVENKFSQFEEWMFASDYEKAKELSSDISLELGLFKEKLDEVPKLYDLAKGAIPHLLEQVSKTFQESKTYNVYLGHLDVPKTIIFVTEKVKENLKDISLLDLEQAEVGLNESHNTLETLNKNIEKEIAANIEMRDKMQSSFSIIEDYTQGVAALVEDAPKFDARFEFANFNEEVKQHTALASEIEAIRLDIEEKFTENEESSLVQLQAMNALIEKLDASTKPFYDLINKVSQANADEIRAQQQLRKLYLIINDVEVRIKKRSLPSISERYVHDLEKSRTYVSQINDILNDDVLDITSLNGTVAEAIDYIYQLHNNVNNLVGVVDMCENSIVYANKYRAYVPSIESELTKAELAFNNGEYTQSLKMIINAIEKFRPNSSYEEMIKNNARSAY
ncbi:MAG: septation ring formation regulator EzrA [Erysipelothrix sp.]|nr:septation ring formation regulator EzrA [Erysipelothrix sp.]